MDAATAGGEDGEPVCWLHLLCPDCGAVREVPADAVCPACGAPPPPGD
ncbi:hypothetical protein [Kineococcus arenarius]